MTNLTNEQIEDIVDKVIKKVWERVLAFGLLLVGAFILISLEMNKARADEVKTTPKEFVETIVVPGKVSNHFQNEWEDIKVYQANSWADMKGQFVRIRNK